MLWGRDLKGEAVIVFMDNDAATGSVVRGYSNAPDLAWIAAKIWDLALYWAISLWLERVDSSSNPADEPSRNQWGLARRGCRQWVCGSQFEGALHSRLNQNWLWNRTAQGVE